MRPFKKGFHRYLITLHQHLHYGISDVGDLIVDDAVEGHLRSEKTGSNSLSVKNSLADLRVKRLLVRVETCQLEDELFVKYSIDLRTA